MLIRIDKAVARCDVSGWSNAHHSEAGAARQRLVDTLMQFSQRVAYVGKAVMLSTQGELQVLVSQVAELG